MRVLLPTPIDAVDPLEIYGTDIGPPPAGRPYVRVNMISSLDGAISVDGRSSLLGGDADRHLFFVLRSLADVVLVGAGTARTEGYGPVRLNQSLRRVRLERRQPTVPQLAVVTRSCDLDWSSSLFTEAEVRPIVITIKNAPETCLRRARKVADVVLAGDDSVDLGQALASLNERGVSKVLGEGGPSLNGYLAAGRFLDELCLTLSPRLAGGDGARVISGPSLPWPLKVEMAQVLEEDGFFFLRLRCLHSRRVVRRPDSVRAVADTSRTNMVSDVAENRAEQSKDAGPIEPTTPVSDIEQEIDQASVDSFPASDAPQWWVGRARP